MSRVTSVGHARVCHLRAPDADDAVDAAPGVVEEGDRDGVLARRQPVPLRGRVDLEDVSSGAEDGLLPETHGRTHHRGAETQSSTNPG